MFLVNSRYPLFHAAQNRHSFSQSYRTNLPSSFNIIISYTLVSSTNSPVSDFVRSFFFLYLNKIKKLLLNSISLLKHLLFIFSFQNIFRDRITNCYLSAQLKLRTFSDNGSHYFSLLISTYLLLFSSKNFTIFIYKNTKYSTTIFFLISYCLFP